MDKSEKKPAAASPEETPDGDGELRRQVEELAERVRSLEQTAAPAGLPPGTPPSGAPDLLARRLIGGLAILLACQRSETQTPRRPLVNAILDAAAPLMSDDWPLPPVYVTQVAEDRRKAAVKAEAEAEAGVG